MSVVHVVLLRDMLGHMALLQSGAMMMSMAHVTTKGQIVVHGLCPI